MTSIDDGIVATILETGNQALCARMLAEDFPDVPRQRTETLISQYEPELIEMGFENLNKLRKELALVHPQWE